MPERSFPDEKSVSCLHFIDNRAAVRGGLRLAHLARRLAISSYQKPKIYSKQLRPASNTDTQS
jgi:hypothetical protein